MIFIIVLLVEAMTSDAEAEAFRKTAPQYLDAGSAREHLVAARVAGLAHDVDPDLLLATAYRESNYKQGVRFRESSGLYSCGVVQVTAKSALECDRLTASLVDGYSGGAAHLRECLKVCSGNMYCALSWYAGGEPFIRNCRDNPSAYGDRCAIPGDRLWRARRIKDLRK